MPDGFWQIRFKKLFQSDLYNYPLNLARCDLFSITKLLWSCGKTLVANAKGRGFESGITASMKITYILHDVSKLQIYNFD